MERLGRKRGEETAFSERRLLQGSVISEHRPDHFDSAEALAIEPATRAPSFDSASAFSRDLL
jgi:hypothetical protein